MRKPDTAFSPAALSAVLFEDLRLPTGTTFKLAYSGGLDSHVLLHALSILRTDHGFSLSAIYIDHGLQTASADWGRHCAHTCKALDVPMTVERIRVDGAEDEGIEAAARRARYAALSAAMAPAEILLTAHHADDQAETVLLQLLRGTGIAGLAAMPLQNIFGSGRHIRPLLGFARVALLAYAQEYRLSWIEDPSNQESHLRRNYLRAEIMPRLARHWPAHASMLARAARHAAEANVLLDEVAHNDLAVCQQVAPYALRALSINALRMLSAARQRNLLRYWLKQQDLLTPTAAQLEEVLAHVQTAPRSQQACVRWPGVEVWRYRDLLAAMPSLVAPVSALDASWDLREPLTLPGVGRLCAVPTRGEGLSCARLNGRFLHIRLRSGGERLLLAGRTHHHALKKLLQAEGVPPWLRTRLPLLYLDRELAAVADRWVCAAYQARDGENGLKIVWEPFAGTAGVSEKDR